MASSEWRIGALAKPLAFARLSNPIHLFATPYSLLAGHNHG